MRLSDYRAKRVYEATPTDKGALALRLADRTIELGAAEYSTFQRLVHWLPSTKPIADVQADLKMDDKRLERFVGALTEAGLLYEPKAIPENVTGLEFHKLFNGVLNSWLTEAFSHPFWERMMSGRGSARLFTGWLIELYHYTKNANRHMALSCAHTREKQIKILRAKHYAEEWDHYHYFLQSLRALGLADEDVETSVPLPMSLALSNFMRQAAREDVLAYSICSAVLEGTTTDRSTYNSYYEKASELYKIPHEAIAPIYAHLALDVQYQHSDLFLDILQHVEKIPAERAARILDYGHQLVEHIWMWTENIEKYYDNAANPVPRTAFDPWKD